jgi:hypothetical protein
LVRDARHGGPNALALTLGRRALIALVATVTLWPAARAQDALSVSSDGFEVDALDRGEDGRPARVMITNRQTSRRHFISINSTLGPLTRAHIRSDEERVVLICENGFAIVDPRGRVPADEVYARNAAASPDGALIAYERFFPETHPGPTAAIALYDTHRPSEANHAAYPAAAERGWHAGWPVYPEASQWKDTSAVVPKDQARELSSTLMWLGDASRPLLVFTIRQGRTDTLVTANPAAEPLQVCTHTLPGDADGWRVKSITLGGTASSRQLRIQPGALTNPPPAVTLQVPAEGC